MRPKHNAMNRKQEKSASINTIYMHSGERVSFMLPDYAITVYVDYMPV